MKTADQRAVLTGAEGVLELVAVAPLRRRGNHRVQLIALEPADPRQRLLNLSRLDLELALVWQDLPGRAGVIRTRRDPVGSRLEHLDRPALGIRAL